MLRKFVNENVKDWPQWLLFLLFAIRMVSQASPGFSPFELLFDRHPRGVLDVLRNEWETFLQGSVSLSAYMTALRNKLKETTKVLREELTKCQEGQKKLYGETVQPHSFAPGQNVLLLLLSSENKLLMGWQEPFKETQWVGGVNYHIQIAGKGEHLFHINLLKEWKTRE